MKSILDIRNENYLSEEVVEDFSEALRPEFVNKFKQLSQVGLIPKEKLPMLIRAFGKGDVDELTYTEKHLVIEIFRNLVDHIVGDRQLFQKVKMSLAKEESVSEDLTSYDARHADLMKDGFVKVSKTEPVYMHPDTGEHKTLLVKDGRVVKEFNKKKVNENIEAPEDVPRVKSAFPVVVVLRRKSIRTFSDGKKAALYYADKLKRYFTVPSTGDIVSEETDEQWTLDEAQVQTRPLPDNSKIQTGMPKPGAYDMPPAQQTPAAEPPAVLSSTAQNIHALRGILTNKQNGRLKFRNGRSMTVDPLTAHVLLHAHGRLSEPENQLDFERTLDKSPEHFMRMAKFASRHYVSDK
jgi:hypothetical protein